MKEDILCIKCKHSRLDELWGELKCDLHKNKVNPKNGVLKLYERNGHISYSCDDYIKKED